jgi:hypothetical protein
MLMVSTSPSKDIDWQASFKKKDLIICLQETHLTDGDKHWLGFKGGKDFPRYLSPTTGRSSSTYQVK